MTPTSRPYALSQDALLEDQKRRFLSLTLAPHRSLPPTGFYIMMGIVVGVALVTGVLFLVVGAWPVFGFLGLDVLALFWAFRISYRQGLAREIVQLDARNMVIERVAPSGHSVKITMDPSWIKVLHDAEAEYARPLILKNPSGAVEIGRFLSQKERREIAPVIRDAIADWRSPHLPSNDVTP